MTGLLARVLPEGAVGEEDSATDPEEPLYPEEAAAVARAVPRRRAEFAAGRACARRALARLGAPVGAIPSGADRAPAWPPEVVGSISHTTGWCAAAVAWRSRYLGLGLDGERPITRDREAIMKMVCRPAELAWLEAGGDREVRSALVFSAKEAVYKCQYPLTRTVLDFHEVELAVDQLDGGGAGIFTASVLPAAVARQLHGRYYASDQLVVTAVAIPTTQ